MGTAAWTQLRRPAASPSRRQTASDRSGCAYVCVDSVLLDRYLPSRQDWQAICRKHPEWQEQALHGDVEVPHNDKECKPRMEHPGQQQLRFCLILRAFAHAWQARAVEAANGHVQQRQEHRQAEPAAVELAAPGLARLTADADGLMVHHCLANRRDLHAEYPPGALPDPSLAKPGHEPSGQQDAEEIHVARGGHEQRGEPAVETGNAGTRQAFDAGPGRLRFPWECGPLLEAVLPGARGAGVETTALTVAELPAPAPEGEVRTSDVVAALIAAGVLLVA